MKKVLLLILLTIFITGCTNKENPTLLPDKQLTFPDTTSQKLQSDTDVFEIREKMFISQCSDIYLNSDDYKNKIIKLEGIYDEYTDPETNKTYYFVIRHAPGCCGDDGAVGFEILYDGDTPELNDWIEVVGTIEMVERNGSEYVALRLSKLTILDERGAEFVSN